MSISYLVFGHLPDALEIWLTLLGFKPSDFLAERRLISYLA